jgi:hypothetical protein
MTSRDFDHGDAQELTKVLESLGIIVERPEPDYMYEADREDISLEAELGPIKITMRHKFRVELWFGFGGENDTVKSAADCIARCFVEIGTRLRAFAKNQRAFEERDTRARRLVEESLHELGALDWEVYGVRSKLEAAVKLLGTSELTDKER